MNTNVTSSAPTQEQSTEKIEKFVNTHFDNLLLEAEAVHPRYVDFIKNTRTVFFAGGKRLRPHLVYILYLAYGGEDTNTITPIAASQEIIHTAMLVADDIIDKDTYRHGKDNITGVYLKEYKLDNEEEKLHYAESVALLSSILLTSSAYQLINQSTIKPEKIKTVNKLMGESIFNTIGGEHIDTNSFLYPQSDTNPMTIMIYKTSYYSFVVPMLSGAVLAGADDTELEKIRKIGICLGIAFQLTDDILGVFGDVEVTGKSNDGDIREGKVTELYIYAKDHANESDRKFLEEYYGNKLINSDQILKVKQIIKDTGALENTKFRVEGYVEDSINSINSLSINDEYKKTLIKVAEKIIGRKY